MELVYNDFCDMSMDEMISIDGGKKWYQWLADIGVGVGAVAVAVPGVGTGYIAAYVGVTYFYSMNR